MAAGAREARQAQKWLSAKQPQQQPMSAPSSNAPPVQPSRSSHGNWLQTGATLQMAQVAQLGQAAAGIRTM